MQPVVCKTEIELRCVWPDYQIIKGPMDIDRLITERVEAHKERLSSEYGISRILLINDVVYSFNNIARDVLKFDPTEMKRLDEEKRQQLYELTLEMADQLPIDPAVPSQAVLWNNDIYLLMSTRATMLRALRN